jgi:hypothetical protein
METRYSLRFESGERTGETIPVPSSGFTIGRKPGNSLQVLDNSVSGNHAVIEIDAEGARVRDLGSTNGTRVGDQRVLEARLAHGDHVTFGNVRVSWIDAEVAAPASSPLPASTMKVAGAGTADGLLRVSADVIARSKKRSRLGLVVVLVLALAGAGAWFYLNRSTHASPSLVRAVQPVDGDLFGDESSFESEHDSWSAGEGSPVAFLRTERARYSGSFGMGCELSGKDWALHVSKEFRADAERELEARAMFRAADGIEMRLGIEFAAKGSSDAEAPGSFVAWTSAAPASSGFEPIRIVASVPPGYATARVCVLARASSSAGQSGGAAFDDVSLVQRSSSSKPTAQVGENHLHVFGDPPSSAMLFKVDRVLISSLEASRERAEAGSAPLALHVAGEATKIQVSVSDALSADGVFTLRAEAPLAQKRIATISASSATRESRANDASGSKPESTAQASDAAPAQASDSSSAQASASSVAQASDSPGTQSSGESAAKSSGGASAAAPDTASAGAEGVYATHGPAFERDNVMILLLGSGNDLVDLKFGAPVRVTGVADGAASRITIHAAGQRSFDLQLDFNSEKKEAGSLAYAARNAEKKGDLGGCLQQWGELLNRYPYESALVAEAESTRGRLIQKGLEELRSIRAEIERARFFRLADLYRQCRDKTLALGTRYAGSEVEAQAKTVASEVGVHLAELEIDLAKNERARLTAIMNTLAAQKSTGLAGEVKAYLDAHFAEAK